MTTELAALECLKSSIFHFLYPHFKKVRGIVLYPPFSKMYVHPSVRPSALRFHSLSGAFLNQFFFKLGIRVEIGKMCLGTADW